MREMHASRTGLQSGLASGLPIPILAVGFATLAAAAPPVVNSEPLPPEAQRAQFKLPPGFGIQLVAAEPQIQKPMNMAFDARGRLWVTHSVEYPFAAPADRKPRDGLTILEDFGPDGRARKATLFADELNIPIGVLPLPRPPGGKTAAIVWSIPHIWKLTDTDDDGRADLREVLYGPFDFIDTHGNQNAFRLGADGWVYANHGFRNTSRVKLRGEGDVVLQLNSGNTYRFRPDGSAIEQVTWGQTNPFGMVFDALGNRFNADCLADAPPADTQLIHAARIAVRSQIAAAKPEDLAAIDIEKLGADGRLLAELAATVKTPPAAWLAWQTARGLPATDWMKPLQAVAETCSAEQVADAARAARTACGDDSGLETNAIQALLGKALTAGHPLAADTDIVRWAVDFAVRLLSGAGTGQPEASIRTAVAVAKMAREPRLAAAWEDIGRIASNPRWSDQVRGEAIDALLALDQRRTLAAAAAVIPVPTEPYAVRIAFAQRCAGVESTPLREAIGVAMKTANAAQQKDWAMVLLSRNDGADPLLGLIAAGRASPLLLQDRQVVGRLKQCGVPDLDGRITALTAGLQPADRRIQQTIGKVAGHFGKAGGAADAGAELFTKHCAACHRLGQQGGLIGPQLDGIGQRGPERLLEDILDPSRNVDEAFRTTIVTLADGRVAQAPRRGGRHRVRRCDGQGGAGGQGRHRGDGDVPNLADAGKHDRPGRGGEPAPPAGLPPAAADRHETWDVTSWRRPQGPFDSPAPPTEIRLPAGGWSSGSGRQRRCRVVARGIGMRIDGRAVNRWRVDV